MHYMKTSTPSNWEEAYERRMVNWEKKLASRARIRLAQEDSPNRPKGLTPSDIRRLHRRATRVAGTIE